MNFLEDMGLEHITDMATLGTSIRYKYCKSDGLTVECSTLSRAYPESAF